MNTESDGLNRRMVEFDIDQAEIFLHLMSEIDDLIENHAAKESVSGTGEQVPTLETSELLLLGGNFLTRKWNQILVKFRFMHRAIKIYCGLVWSRFTSRRLH